MIIDTKASAVNAKYISVIRRLTQADYEVPGVVAPSEQEVAEALGVLGVKEANAVIDRCVLALRAVGRRCPGQVPEYSNVKGTWWVHS